MLQDLATRVNETHLVFIPCHRARHFGRSRHEILRPVAQGVCERSADQICSGRGSVPDALNYSAKSWNCSAMIAFAKKQADGN
jgi:hypothetical protein